MRVPLLLSLALAASLAGCINASEGSKPAAAPTTPSTSAASFGVLNGTVTDDEFVPIPGVQVVVAPLGWNQTTGESGAFRFDQVPSGDYDVSFTHGDYVAKTVDAQVLGAHETSIQVQLSLIPDRKPSISDFHRAGRYDCAVEVPIYPGDCAVDLQGHEDDGVTRESYIFPFDVGARWDQVLVEMVWTDGGNNQLDGMHLYLSPGNESDPYGHHTKIAVAEGGSKPLRILVTRGEVHATAEKYEETNEKAVVPATGGPLQVLVYPRGKFADTLGSVCDSNGRCFLGVGAGLNIDFDVYVTIFYNQRMPEGFTAVPPS